jgi:hypothetical protein
VFVALKVSRKRHELENQQQKQTARTAKTQNSGTMSAADINELLLKVEDYSEVQKNTELSTFSHKGLSAMLQKFFAEHDLKELTGDSADLLYETDRHEKPKKLIGIWWWGKAESLIQLRPKKGKAVSSASPAKEYLKPGFRGYYPDPPGFDKSEPGPSIWPSMVGINGQEVCGCIYMSFKALPQLSAQEPAIDKNVFRVTMPGGGKVDLVVHFDHFRRGAL